MESPQEKTLFEENFKRHSILVPLPVGKAYTYTQTDGMELGVGDYVRVPVGRREVLGVVWHDPVDKQVSVKKLKDIISKYDCAPMSTAMQSFIDWVAKYTLADRGSVLKMALSQPAALDPPKPELGYILAEKVDVSLLPEKRKNVAKVLTDGCPRKAGTIAKMAGCSTSVIQTMAKHNLLTTVEMLPETPCHLVEIKPSDVTLSDGQAVSGARLVDLVSAKEFQTVLLDGVTGAGKTEVYFEAVAEAMRLGKQAVILLPEIALSTQFVERFETRFGVKPALWHSDVSVGQKKLIWRGVAEGKTKCVIGARSALFLPYADLGVMIVDEEHDASFKQEEGVIYNARDMAIMRAKLEKCPAILVSATPSLETMVNAKSGRYEHLKLSSRYGGAEMPDIHVIDLRKDKPERQSFLSPPLRAAMTETLEKGEQVMLFLNRRGYAPLTLCRTCGHRFECPSCTAWLVEHKKTNRLHCHHCGLSIKLPEICPECEDEGALVACGPGVERIAEEVAHVFPDAKPLILASDITNSHTLLTDAIHAVRDGDVDVIIGTQMIAKGHHFPQLTCVGVVDADLGLSGADLRAGERTYQLLHQVSGRAGRGAKPGHVYLQTYMPGHRVLMALAEGDRDKFLDVEATERLEAQMPPYGRLAALVISGPDEARVGQYCQNLARIAPRYDGVQILGPAPAALSILRGNHRMRFLIKTDQKVSIQKLLSDWLLGVKVPNMVRVKVDIDPQSFL